MVEMGVKGDKMRGMTTRTVALSTHPHGNSWIKAYEAILSH
jgi:hypothetical protein